jgi:hypothetical protein
MKTSGTSTFKFRKHEQLDSVRGIWIPLLTDGKPVTIGNPEGEEKHWIIPFPRPPKWPRIRTAVASVTEMAAELQDREWHPKIGAAFVKTVGTELYAPHNQVRVTFKVSYHRPIPVGIMIHLSFENTPIRTKGPTGRVPVKVRRKSKR